jgi:hypothetical protein
MTQAPDSPSSELPELETDHHSSQVRSSPPVFFLVCTVLAIIGFAAAAFYILSPASEPPEDAVSISTPELTPSSIEVEAETPDTDHLTQIPELENRLMMLIQQFKAQSELIEQLQGRFDGLDASMEQTVTRVTAELDRKISQLESTVTNQAAALDTRFTALEKNQKPQKAAKKKKPLWAPTLPFSLLSVDYWDNKPYAVLGYKGGLRHLNPGETLHKWTLTSLKTNQATFRYWNGVKRQLDVEG